MTVISHLNVSSDETFDIDIVILVLFTLCCRLAEQPRHHSVRCFSFPVRRRRALPSAFPVLRQPFFPIQQNVYEANLRNSNVCSKKYVSLPISFQDNVNNTRAIP